MRGKYHDDEMIVLDFTLSLDCFLEPISFWKQFEHSLLHIQYCTVEIHILNILYLRELEIVVKEKQEQTKHSLFDGTIMY